MTDIAQPQCMPAASELGYTGLSLQPSRRTEQFGPPARPPKVARHGALCCSHAPLTQPLQLLPDGLPAAAGQAACAAQRLVLRDGLAACPGE